MLEISNNSLSILKACPKKYYWRYIEGLNPSQKSRYLTLGSVIHTAFDMYYNRFNLDEIFLYINTTLDDEISKAGPQEEEDYITIKYIAIGMWIWYPKDLSVFTDIKPEMEFSVPVLDGVVLVGKVDGLVEHEGKLWVRELKTTSMSSSQFEARCGTAPQGTAYVWAMRKLGFPVEGVIYDYIKKPLLRKNKSEDVHKFGKRIIDDYKSRPEYYFQRFYSYRNLDTLEMFEEDLISTTKDLQSKIKTKSWYRNPDQCWNYNSECPYKKICFQKVPDQLTIDLYFERKYTINKGFGITITIE